MLSTNHESQKERMGLIEAGFYKLELRNL